MTKANIYLNFDGNCEEAFLFYRSVFNVEFPYIGRFRDMPQEPDSPSIPEEFGNRIMHVSLPVGGDTVIMGSDTGGDWAPTYVQGNNFSISLNTDSREEADRLFNGLSAGGQVTMPMQLTFWKDYFGMFTDKFGINWMISFATEEHK